MDPELAKWTRHFRLMAEGKLQKHSKGYCVVDQVGSGNPSLRPSDITDRIPQRYKPHVGQILSRIVHIPKKILWWNNEGELVYKDTIIPGSDIIELLKDSQNIEKEQLAGTTEFYKGLEEMKTPISLYKRKKRQT